MNIEIVSIAMSRAAATFGVVAEKEKQAFAQQEKALSVLQYLPPMEIKRFNQSMLPPTRKERRKVERNAKKFKK